MSSPRQIMLVGGIACAVGLMVWLLFSAVFGMRSADERKPVRSSKGAGNGQSESPTDGSNGQATANTSQQAIASQGDMRAQIREALENLRKYHREHDLDALYASLKCKVPVFRKGDIEHERLSKAFNSLVWVKPENLFVLLDVMRTDAELGRLAAFYYQSGMANSFRPGSFFAGDTISRLLKEVEFETSPHLRSVLIKCLSNVRHVPRQERVQLDGASVDRLISIFRQVRDSEDFASMLPALAFASERSTVRMFMINSALDKSLPEEYRFLFVAQLQDIQMSTEELCDLIVRLAGDENVEMAIRGLRLQPRNLSERHTALIRDAIVQRLDAADGVTRARLACHLASLDDPQAIGRFFEEFKQFDDQYKQGALTEIGFRAAAEGRNAYVRARDLLDDHLLSVAKDLQQSGEVRLAAYVSMGELLQQRAAQGDDRALQRGLELVQAALNDPSPEVGKFVSQLIAALKARYGLDFH